jgi:hypothetical protein
MGELGSLGVQEMAVLCCTCVVPLVIVLGVVIALLVVVRGRRPKVEGRAEAPQVPAPMAPIKPVARPEPSPASEPPAKTRATAVEEPLMKSCSSCGADNPVGNAFCEYCGASLAEK